MLGPIARYAHWLHTRRPPGAAEPLPELGADGTASVPGVTVSGDLTGIPLLKFSLDTGARAVQRIAEELSRRDGRAADPGRSDLVIIGAGVSGMAAAVEAKRLGLSYTILEATEAVSTVLNFPKGKPIYTYPKAMTPAGAMQVSARV